MTSMYSVGPIFQFAAVEAILTPIMDKWPKILYKPMNRMIFVGLYCILCFLVGLLLVTEVRNYMSGMIYHFFISGKLLSI